MSSLPHSIIPKFFTRGIILYHKNSHFKQLGSKVARAELCHQEVSAQNARNPQVYQMA